MKSIFESKLMHLIWHWLLLAVALWILTCIRPLGISYHKPSDLAWAAMVLILFNTFLRPVLILVTLPMVLLTLGLFLLVINALILFWLPHFVPGFRVPTFASAFFGSILLSLITGFLSRS